MKKIKIPFTNKVIISELEYKRLKKIAIKYCGGFYKHCANIREGSGKYSVCRTMDEYAVISSSTALIIPIKCFPFGDDEQYAKLCAEELCEMLNNN